MLGMSGGMLWFLSKPYGTDGGNTIEFSPKPSLPQHPQHGDIPGDIPSACQGLYFWSSGLLEVPWELSAGWISVTGNPKFLEKYKLL